MAWYCLQGGPTRRKELHASLRGFDSTLEYAFQLSWCGGCLQGANQEDRVARQVELALTRRDHLGNVLTPKQGFRELCYRSAAVSLSISALHLPSLIARLPSLIARTLPPFAQEAFKGAQSAEMSCTISGPDTISGACHDMHLAWQKQYCVATCTRVVTPKEVVISDDSCGC